MTQSHKRNYFLYEINLTPAMNSLFNVKMSLLKLSSVLKTLMNVKRETLM